MMDTIGSAKVEHIWHNDHVSYILFVFEIAYPYQTHNIEINGLNSESDILN